MQIAYLSLGVGRVRLGLLLALASVQQFRREFYVRCLSVVETECTWLECTMESVLETHRTRARVRWNCPKSKSDTGNVP